MMTKPIKTLSLNNHQQIEFYQDYFLTHNRLFFWQLKKLFLLAKIEEVRIFTNFYRKFTHHFHVRIHMKDSRSFFFRVHGYEWGNIEKYFRQRSIQVQVFDN